jgi:hypothetical protein
MKILLTFIKDYLVFIALFLSISFGVLTAANSQPLKAEYKFDNVYRYLYCFFRTFIFNFIGWVCMYILLDNYLSNALVFNVSTFILFALALFGVSNDLQNIFFLFSNTFHSAGNVIGEWIKSKCTNKV